jgi:acyl-homoserine lactone acylase PvdQ
LGKPGERFTVRDCELLQNDSYSHIAEELTPYILNALRDSSADVPMKDRVFEYFRNWNFQYTRDDIATAIFQEFMVHFLRDVFEDEMGEDAFHDWVMLTNIPLRVTLALVHEGTSPWFDDVRTPAVEARSCGGSYRPLRQRNAKLALGESPYGNNPPSLRHSPSAR